MALGIEQKMDTHALTDSKVLHVLEIMEAMAKSNQTKSWISIQSKYTPSAPIKRGNPIGILSESSSIN